MSAVVERSQLELSKPRRTAAEGEDSYQKAFHDDLKKRAEMDATVVCIDKTKTSVQVKPGTARESHGLRPSVKLSGQRDWMCLLGAVTEDGESFFSRFTEYVTAEHEKYFILLVCKEFEKDLIAMLDGAPYFQMSALTALAARGDLAFVAFPAYSPELNPVVECWRQFQDALSNRFFDSLEELTTAIDTALGQLSLPKVSNYFNR